MTKSESGRLGGSKNTRAKRTALAALHAARRGVPVNPEPAGWRPILTQLLLILRTPDRTVGRSRRALASELGLTDKSLRRWLAGECFPPAQHLPALRSWIRRME